MLRGRNVGKLLDVTSFITEMVRFNEFRPSLFLYCLRKLRLLRSLESAQVIALLMERCGPVLLFVDQVRPSINYELDRLHDMCRNNIVDSDSAAVLMNAYYACRPQERPKVIRTQLPPQQRYLRHLLTDVLSPRDVDASCQRVTEKLLKFPLEDDATLEMVVQEVLREQPAGGAAGRHGESLRAALPDGAGGCGVRESLRDARFHAAGPLSGDRLSRRVPLRALLAAGRQSPSDLLRPLSPHRVQSRCNAPSSLSRR